VDNLAVKTEAIPSAETKEIDEKNVEEPAFVLPLTTYGVKQDLMVCQF
jgi:hypothetical protein